MEKNIRFIEEKDLDSILKIYNYEILNDTNTFDTSIKDKSNRLEWMKAHNKNNPIFVYIVDEMVVGYASLSKFNSRDAYDISAELSLYVDNNYRNKGIGKSLLDYIINYAKNNTNLKTIISIITSTNEKSIKLHEDFNFIYAGTIENVGIKFNKLLSVSYYYLNI